MLESIIFSFKLNIHFGVPKTKYDEGLGTLYRWAPGEPSEYTPPGRNRDVRNCLNRDSWKPHGAQQGVSYFYNTYSTEMSYGKSDKQWELRRAWNYHAKIYRDENRKCEEICSSKKELRIRIAIFLIRFEPKGFLDVSTQHKITPLLCLEELYEAEE